MMWSSLMYLSLSMAEVSLASSCVLSLEPLMNRFWARTESVEYLLWWNVCGELTCHRVVLPGHVTEALHQGSLQLPGSRPRDPAEVRILRFSFYCETIGEEGGICFDYHHIFDSWRIWEEKSTNLNDCLLRYLEWSFKASSAGSGRWILSPDLWKKTPCLSLVSTYSSIGWNNMIYNKVK